MAKAEVTIPLDIPEVRVVQTTTSERGEIVITIESAKTGTSCRKCGNWITKLHGRDERVTLRHLPVFGRPTYLRYRPRRYQCRGCEGYPTTTEKLEWHDANSPHSFAYGNHVLLHLVNSTIEDVSSKEGLSYESVAGALERRMKAEVVEFLRLIPQRILQTVQAVCCDLWEAYIEVVRQEIPTARIVADRFHLARHYRDEADQIRKEELRRLKKGLSKEAYQQLNGSYHAFRKNAKGLNKEKRKTLRRFFDYSPDANTPMIFAKP